MQLSLESVIFALAITSYWSLVQGSMFCFKDSEVSSCLPEFQCSSIQDIESKLQNDSTIYFCPTKIELNYSIVLQNLVNITLRAYGEGVILTCAEPGSGLAFIQVSDLTIINLKIDNCGSKYNSTTQMYSSPNKTVPLVSAVYLVNCSNIKLRNIQISNSSGIGLVIFDTKGLVEVLNSTFCNNLLKEGDQTSGGGGGVYVEFTVCTPGVYCTDFYNATANLYAKHNTYIFRDSIFSNNKAESQSHSPKFEKYTKKITRLTQYGLGRGGGLSIQLNGEAEYNMFVVENCTFKENEANWGGGIFIAIQDKSRHNVIKIRNVTVIQNTCYPSYGGGGVDLGLNIAYTANNTVTFESAVFKQNRALFGGGVRIYSSRRHDSQLQNTIQFNDSQWISNTARFGSAIDIAPHVWEILSDGFLPVPLFHNCEFKSNRVDNYITMGIPRIKMSGRGAMMLTEFGVRFSGSVIFEDNDGSALFLSSSTIDFAINTICIFKKNRAFEGGAIALVGYSALYVHENCFFLFSNNTATRRGGAIFAYNIDKHNYVSSRSCFIQYYGLGDLVENNNVTFIFSKNYAGQNIHPIIDCYGLGHSIFSASLLACIYACQSERHDLNQSSYELLDAFKCIGKFNFSSPADLSCEVSTSGSYFDVSNLSYKGTLKMFPGQETTLNISLYNNFNKSINASYYASVSGQEIILSNAYVSSKVQLYGSPNSTGILTLETLGYRELTLDINVSLIDCPPGYVISTDGKIDNEKAKICVCSAFLPNKKFKSIPNCDNATFRAYLQNGYWLGLYHSELAYGTCPKGYCANFDTTTKMLPESKDLLDREICGNYRKGIMCGECRFNYSVHYHSSNYTSVALTTLVVMVWCFTLYLNCYP